MTRSIAATVTAIAFAVGALATAAPAAAGPPQEAAVVRVYPAAVRPAAVTYPAPFLQVSTPARVYVGSPVTRIGVAANLSTAYEDFEVQLVGDCTNTGIANLIGVHTVYTDKPTKTLRTTVDVITKEEPFFHPGSYVFRINAFTDQNDDDVVVCTPTTVRRSSLLGLNAARTGDTIALTVAARQYVIVPREGYTAWAGRTVSIQRYTSTGWATIRNVPTDANGNLSVHLTIPFKAALRVRDADTGSTWGAVSNSEIR